MLFTDLKQLLPQFFLLTTKKKLKKKKVKQNCYLGDLEAFCYSLDFRDNVVIDSDY